MTKLWFFQSVKKNNQNFFTEIEMAIKTDHSQAPELLKQNKSRLSIALCDSILNLISKTKIAKNNEWKKNKESLPLRMKEAESLLEKNSIHYYVAMSSIQRSHNKAEEDHTQTMTNLEQMESFTRDAKMEIEFREKKQALHTYLNDQITRINNEPPNLRKNKDKALVEFSKQLRRIDDPDQIHQFNHLLTDVKNRMYIHRERGFFAMVFKFNWFRNTKSYNQLNEIFDERNQLRR